MADIQDGFAAALLDPDAPTPDGLIRPDGAPASRRFDVYRNNVVVSLSEALADAFPVVKSLVGDAFFAAMAGVYVRAHPPTTPLMMFYGGAFAEFLHGFEPARSLPYLPDMARLEFARRCAYHAADEPVADPAVLEGLSADVLLNVRLVPQPASHVIASEHPIFSIWRFNSTEDKSPIEQAPEDVLVTRPVDMVEMHRLPPGGAAFFVALQSGACLGEAAEAAAAAADGFDLGANLGGLFQARALTRITFDGDNNS